jgi:hypothetical protein
VGCRGWSGHRLNLVFEELGLKYVERPIPAEVWCSPSGKVATPKAGTVKASSIKGVAGTAKAEAKKRKGVRSNHLHKFLLFQSLCLYPNQSIHCYKNLLCLYSLTQTSLVIFLSGSASDSL